jgi:hypothetical protein
MLSILTRRFRFKAAAALAVLYSFCVLAPAAALAVADQEATAHCLTEPHGHSGAHHHAHHVHKHADGKAHVHDDAGTVADHSSDDKAQAGKCCGLFCLTALATTNVPTLGKPALTTAPLATTDAGLAGRDPERITRPPIA